MRIKWECIRMREMKIEHFKKIRFQKGLKVYVQTNPVLLCNPFQTSKFCLDMFIRREVGNIVNKKIMGCLEHSGEKRLPIYITTQR
jgi:hypothetical protein